MSMKMDKTSIIVCSVIGTLGLLSAIMGFSAEGTKLTPYTILVYGDDCVYPQNPAIGLGICAAIFLIVAEVTFSAVSSCCGCCKSRSIPSETKRIVAIVCAVFSWIAAVIAFALFIEGAAWNANVVRVAEAPYCPYLKDGVFAGAGVLALAATALGITSFIMQRQGQPAAAAAAGDAAMTTAPASAAGTPAGGQSPSVVMGHPLLPSGKPQNDYPVKPQQGYEQAQVHPQGYAQAPQTTKLQTPPPAAAQDNNVFHAPPNHQLPPRPPVPAAAAAPPAVVVAAAAASEPASVLQPALGAVAMGQPLPPQIVPLQYSVPPIPAVAPQVGGVDIPAGVLPSAPPSTAGSIPSALSTAIRNEVARQGVKLVAQVVTNSLLSDNNTAGDGGVLSMMTGSAGGDAVEATN